MIDSWVDERLGAFASATAFRGGAGSVSFGALRAKVQEWRRRLAENRIASGSTVVLNADFSPQSIAAILALYLNKNIIAPLHDADQERATAVCRLVGADYLVAPRPGFDFTAERQERGETHPLVATLNAKGEAGLILVSSGSTGKPKAMLLSLEALFAKYKSLERKSAVVLTFLLFDHIGGFNTVFHTLFSGGTVVPAYSRTVDDVCSIIERHRVEILPTTPTFLNMLLLARAWETYDLSSLRLITYGTEVMPESTLTRLAAAFPGVRLKQTYGMSEIGILSTKSENSTSLWLSIGDGVQHKVVDGVLWLKSKTAMLGYLNAASPFDDDGWLCTGDLVEQNGDKYRIIGRKEKLINVAGLKVYPAEVESRLLQLEGVEDVVAWGKRNPVTGQIVAVKIRVAPAVRDLDAFSARVRDYCNDHLEDYKRPRHISLTTEALHTARFKKMGAENTEAQTA